jgi:hypothetical protein
MSYAVVIEGLASLGDLGREESERIKLAAVQAINKTAERARARAAKDIGEQVNFPKSYLAPSGGRLALAERATRGKMEATIRARSRPTSLARFVVGGGKPGGRGGVTVSVKPGNTKRLPRAFLMRLKSGADATGNLGLAMRLKPGETLKGAFAKKKMKNGLYLLYGPSVDQVLLSNKGTGVARDIEDETAEFLDAEFQRLMEL